LHYFIIIVNFNSILRYVNRDHKLHMNPLLSQWQIVIPLSVDLFDFSDVFLWTKESSSVLAHFEVHLEIHEFDWFSHVDLHI